MIQSLVIIVAVPIIITVILTAIMPAFIKLYVAIPVYFGSAIICAFVASELYHQRLRSWRDVVATVRYGLTAFGWWLLAMTVLIGTPYLLAKYG